MAGRADPYVRWSSRGRRSGGACGSGRSCGSSCSGRAVSSCGAGSSSCTGGSRRTNRAHWSRRAGNVPANPCLVVVASFVRGDEAHAAVARVDAGFEHTRRRVRGEVRNRHDQKDQGENGEAGDACSAWNGDVHRVSSEGDSRPAGHAIVCGKKRRQGSTGAGKTAGDYFSFNPLPRRLRPGGRRRVCEERGGTGKTPAPPFFVDLSGLRAY